MARLVVESGPDTGREFPLGDVAVIGRLKTAQVALSDMNASREHTRVLHQGSDWFLVDLGSRNGTLVNGKNIQRHKLAQGDRIGVGKTVMRFEADGRTGVAAVEAAPVAKAAAAPPPKEGAALPPKAVAAPPPKEGAALPPKAAAVPVPKPAGPATRALVPQTKPLPKREVSADKAPIAADARRAVALSGGSQALLVAGAILVALVVLAATWWVANKMFGKVMEKPAPVRKK